ncbi:uncharacterized protein LOC126843094 [Adelges cooleyi]|uniref:uncharacterized protein LOC126843094 n=1 Tax=Adelges cooleyi TaxID=133065 RepID=UPI0021808453|nr:uncharacterized protein LOC126843094 [Adelges cooleyi]
MEQRQFQKILDKATYEEICTCVDELIDCKELNRYHSIERTIKSKYEHIDPRSLQSIIDQRVQKYTVQRHRSVFSGSLYTKYKDIEDKSKFPLLDLSDNLKMPAMLVAKALVQEKMRIEKQHSESTQSTNEISNITTNTSVNELSSATINTTLNDTLTTEENLLSQLQWLSNAITSKVNKQKEENKNSSFIGEENLSLNSSTTSTLSCNHSNHRLTTNTYLIKDDPVLAYQVFVCSVMDSYYGSCAEQLKSLNGKRYEHILRQKINKYTDLNHALYWTESQCRARGLDMTPDIVLHEPVALVQNEDKTFFVNWIESKAMFGCEGSRTRGAFQKQLFPYWNRYGPGVVVYWFGYVDNKTQDGDLSKYCFLADDWPPKNSKILRYNNNLKKKVQAL